MAKEIEPSKEAFIAGIAWLAQGGRTHAVIIQQELDDNEQLSADLDEAASWVGDLADGVTISE